MKYPQLVSTRAVNAISDWLVSRLEQIGVEAPLIYSRLLLSLLHSSVQINDPIEFNNLEKYFTNQKGSKRFPPNDTETIKKFTAIQCLLDAVSTEQEISCIEKLVDELFDKLINLEKQSSEEDEDSHFNHQHNTNNSYHLQQKLHQHQQLPANSIKSSSSSKSTLDIEDPRKRYYRAFPALSKEMEDSVWLTKHNGKSLTWPTGNTETSSSNMVALNNTAGVKRKNKRRRYHQGLNKNRIGNVRNNSYGGNSSPTWDTDFEGNWEMGTDLIKEFLMSQKNRNRSISESGASNFVYEKNTEKRMKPAIRDTVINKMKSSDSNEAKFCTSDHQNLACSTMVVSNTNNLNRSNNNALVMKDINIIMNNKHLATDDDMNENHVPYDELITFKDFDHISNMTRQLYHEDITYDKNDKLTVLQQEQQQQNDFAQFEAKFNSDVEALWNDDKKMGTNNIQLESVADSLRNKRNIDNFWTNYYNHHYNSDTIDDKAIRSFIQSTSEEQNDCYSLPSIFGGKLQKSNIEKSAEQLVVGSVSGVEKDLSSVGVFISDSIWSDSKLAIKKCYNDENSFYSDCWAPKTNDQQTIDSQDEKSLPNAFNISKWSECSFETPFVPTSIVSNASNNTIGPDSSKASMYATNYKQPIAPASSNKTNAMNNLFPAQSQLSQPVSLPDYYGSSLCCFAVDNKKTQLPPPPGLPSSAMTSSHQSSQASAASASTNCISDTTTTTTTTRTVSLTNHSKTSGFIEYSIVKSSFSLFQSNQIAKYDRATNLNQSRSTIPLVPPSSNNTLLSTPGVGDGTLSSVTAANNSSASSSSPLDDDDNLLTSYRTHFRPIKQNYADGYQFDISGSLDTVDFERSESGNLYLESERYFEYTRFDTFLSDEDSSSSSSSSMYSLSEDRYRDGACVEKVRGLYPLKFRMKQSDKQCQTDDSLQTSTLPRNDQIIIAKRRNINNREKVDKIDNNLHDEVDCGIGSDCYFNEETSIDLDKWTMAEIGKKCADNNNTHTLWGMCPACTKENKCIPANRLLKDELTIEADEIMSDLKYMQDLYICSDWENEDDDNDTDSELEALKNDDEDDDDSRFGQRDSAIDNDDDGDNEEQEQIFYNITKLISDLLKPENAKSLVNALSAGTGNKSKNIFKGISSEDELFDNTNNTGGSLFDYQKNIIWKNVNNNNNNNEKYVGGLWSNDENIIWKREMKPLGNNWARMNDNKTAAFLEKLNWEHTNLASIWTNGGVTAGIGSERKSSSSSINERCASKSSPDMISRFSTVLKSESDAHFKTPANEHIENKEATTTMNATNHHAPRNQISWNISAAEAADLLSQRRFSKKSLNCCTLASQNTINRPDRKRRHSASQNISCTGNCSNDGSRVALEWCLGSTREMSAKIGGCNKVEIMAKWESDSSKLSSLINVDDSLSSSSLSPKTTIITCKYWTTMDTTLASPYFMDKSSHYDGIGAMALNPSSILRHVAVVSRPLTR